MATRDMMGTVRPPAWRDVSAEPRYRGLPAEEKAKVFDAWVERAESYGLEAERLTYDDLEVPEQWDGIDRPWANWKANMRGALAAERELEKRENPGQWAGVMNALRRGIAAMEQGRQTLAARDAAQEAMAIDENVSRRAEFAAQSGGVASRIGRARARAEGRPLTDAEEMSQAAAAIEQVEGIEQAREGAMVPRAQEKMAEAGQAAQAAADAAGLVEFYQSGEGVRAFHEAKGFKESAKAFAANPVEIVAATLAESTAPMVQAIVTGAGGGRLAGTAGVAGGAFIGALNAEMTMGTVDALAESGVDIRDPEQLLEAVQDEKLWAKARERALKGGVPRAAFDAVGMVVGAKLATLKGMGAGQKLAVGTATEAAAGSTGESAGQLAESGRITSGKEVFLEGIAEIGMGAGGAATQLASKMARGAQEARARAGAGADQGEGSGGTSVPDEGNQAEGGAPAVAAEVLPPEALPYRQEPPNEERGLAQPPGPMPRWRRTPQLEANLPPLPAPESLEQQRRYYPWRRVQVPHKLQYEGGTAMRLEDARRPELPGPPPPALPAPKSRVEAPKRPRISQAELRAAREKLAGRLSEERAKSSKQAWRFIDEEYKKAILVGDDERARAALNMAARASGEIGPVFHGSRAERLDGGKLSTKYGAYFTSDRSHAENFLEVARQSFGVQNPLMVEAYVKLNNAEIFDASDENQRLRFIEQRESSDEQLKRGYDGQILKQDQSSYEVRVNSPEQIRSAALIETGPDGNIIVPSNRFGKNIGSQNFPPGQDKPKYSAGSEPKTPNNGSLEEIGDSVSRPGWRKVSRRGRGFRTRVGDLLDVIDDFGGVMSRTTARRVMGRERFNLNRGDWDDSPRLAPSFNFIYRRGGGLKPDQITQMLVDEGLLPEGATTPDMWRAVREAADARRLPASKGQDAADAYYAEEERAYLQTREFADAQVRTAERVVGQEGFSERGQSVEVDELVVGDTFEVEGEDFVVLRVNDVTGEVVVEDGRRFGRQRLDNGDLLWVENLDMVPREAETDATAEDDLTLESVTEEQLETEEATREQRRKLQEGADRRLEARDLDTTADMFGEGETPLFNERRDDPDLRYVDPPDDPAVMGIRGAAAVQRVWDNLGRIGARYFRSRGLLPEGAFESKVAAEAAQRAMHATATQNVRALERAINKLLPPRRQGLKARDTERARLLREVNRYMVGDIGLFNLPPEVRPVAREMRHHVDRLSTQMMAEGVVQGDLVQIFLSNLGSYLNRAYRIFDDPKWRERVPAAAKNKALAFFRSNEPMREGETKAEYDNRIRNMMEEALDVGEEVRGALGGRRTISKKAVSILKKRGDVPPAIRALWGEYTDAESNYARSIAKMSQLLASHRFLTAMKADGYGRYLFDRETAPPGFTMRVSAEGNPALEPIDGLVTSPDIHQALGLAFKSTDPGALMTWWYRANGIAKHSKTVLSPITHVRNFTSGTLYTIANGNVPNVFHGDAIRLTAVDLAPQRVLEALERGGHDVPAWRQHYQKLVELGVISEDVRSGELYDTMRDALGHRMDFIEMSASRWRRTVGRGGSWVARTYQAEDAFWKVVNFEAERRKYRKAYPGWTEARVNERAAQIVRDTLPTYSLVPEISKKLRQFPLAGPFVSFSSEVVRNSWNILRLSVEEMRNPATREIGVRRMAGFMLAQTLPVAAVMMGRALTGTDEDDDQAMRTLAAPWDKTALLMMLPATEDGHGRFINLSYMDPFAMWKTPMVAFRREDLGGMQQRLMNAAVEWSKPFHQEEIFSQAVQEILANRKRDAGQIYNPTEPFPTKVAQSLAHLWKAMEPGFINQARRVYKAETNTAAQYGGRTYDLRTELTALATGQRVVTLDPVDALSWVARKYKDDRAQATQIFTRVMGRADKVSDEELETSWKVMQETRARLMTEMAQAVDAASRLGVRTQDLATVLKSQEVGNEEDRQAILRGQVRPWKMTDEQIKRAALRPGRLQQIMRVIGREAFDPRGMQRAMEARRKQPPPRPRLVR